VGIREPLVGFEPTTAPLSQPALNQSSPENGPQRTPPSGPISFATPTNRTPKAQPNCKPAVEDAPRGDSVQGMFLSGSGDAT
jgi:hypothetical protein